MSNMEQHQEKWIKARLSETNTPAEEVTAFNEISNDLKVSILQFAERTGMQVTGERNANADTTDIRSLVEVSLCEEVAEEARAFFWRHTRTSPAIEYQRWTIALRDFATRVLLKELHNRRLCTIKALGAPKGPKRRREFKS